MSYMILPSHIKSTRCMGTTTASVVLFILLTALVPIASADDYTSTNFTSRNPLTNIFGGYGTSTGFSFFSSGGQSVTGESTSLSFKLQSGFLYFSNFTPASQNWRWYDDESSETPTSALADEEVSPANIANNNVIKLRLTIKETADFGNADTKYKLQFSEYSDFSQDVVTVVESGSCLVNSIWCYAEGGGADNGVITTKVLSDADSCSGSVGNGCGTHNESGTLGGSFMHKKITTPEFEFTIKARGAEQSRTYFFRAFDVTNNQAVPLNTGESYPSLATGDATLSISVSGLGSGTATQGITTDITTTPTSIPYGNLSIGSEIEAAQRISVSTNANEGYQIFAFQQQNFLSTTGAEIEPITGTNPVPTSWTGGCSVLATGCWGYHTGDATLAGGSTRFAANDTYARLETDAKEVAFNAFPVTNETTDMVYKVQVTNQQVAGAYQSSISYVIVPTF